jgi:(p)ppGpp synthase/HD superfamily hydrolase
MQKFKTLNDAIALAEFAHRNQKDKAGLDYIEHPKRVLAAVQAQGALPYVQIAAVLHDVTEDSAFTPKMLLELGFAEPAVNIIKLVDRDYSANLRERLEENWPDWRLGELKSTPDEYYYTEIKKNRDALMVKLADIGDNMQPWRLSYFGEETKTRLIRKYTKALEILNPKPVNHGMLTDHVHNPFRPGGV